ncbi:hypothetical protein RZS08_37745, partial [Arthrospira platensis SPKY1]|nr:hypothetical protein [Arthrospira platensis SPKY1]
MLPPDRRKMLNLAVALSAALLLIWGYLILERQQHDERIPPTTSVDMANEQAARDARLDSLRVQLGADFPAST